MEMSEEAVFVLRYRKIEVADDGRIAEIIRANLKRLHLNIPGTAYFDPELDHLSAFYSRRPERRAYFVGLEEDGQIVGGTGIAEFDGIRDCAELQKLYLDDSAKGKGYGKELAAAAENWARSAGYRHLYLETHTNFAIAMKLYEKMGFRRIEKPGGVVYGTMDHFYMKDL